MTSISKVITEYVRDREEVSAVEVASYLLFVALQELNVSHAALKEAEVGAPVLWTGALAEARDALKRPGVMEDILQEEMFPGDHGAFLCIGRDPQTGGRFKRRRACFKEEYRAGLALLEEKADQIQKKIDRYRNDYNMALPFWTDVLTFGEAYRRAMENRTKTS